MSAGEADHRGDPFRSGDTTTLEELRAEHPAVATARLREPERVISRARLHVSEHVPQAGAKSASLVATGADVDTTA